VWKDPANLAIQQKKKVSGTRRRKLNADELEEFGDIGLLPSYYRIDQHIKNSIHLINWSSGVFEHFFCGGGPQYASKKRVIGMGAYCVSGIHEKDLYTN